MQAFRGEQRRCIATTRAALRQIAIWDLAAVGNGLGQGPSLPADSTLAHVAILPNLGNPPGFGVEAAAIALVLALDLNLVARRVLTIVIQ